MHRIQLSLQKKIIPHWYLIPRKQLTWSIDYFFDNVVEDLLLKRSKPKDAQVRRLLEYYYTMKQMKNETVSQFSHRSVNTEHKLDRLIPEIHRMPSSEETELLYAYTIKLKTEIQKELVSRDFGKFKKLNQLIETEERYELCLQTENLSNSLENWSQSSFSAVLDNDNKQVKPVITAKNRVISNTTVQN